MQKTMKISAIHHTVRRFISSSSTIYKNYATRESKFMTRFLKRSEPKRKWYKNNPPAALDFHSSLLKEKQPSIYTKRRMDVLNKLFMKHITDLMSTSEAASELSERGFEVTNVSISSNYKILNIFWILEKVESKNWPTTIEEVLQKNSYILRHELSQMQIISYVPIICFVKDKKLSLAREVQDRLASLDFDKDYIETNDKTIQLDITNDDTTDHSNNSFQITLPEMKHDVLGLDHHRIMLKIKNSMNKSKNRINKDILDPHSELKAQPLSTFLDNKNISKSKNQQELFIEFLKKRKIEERRKYRLRNNKHLQPIYDKTHNDDNNDDETYFDQDFDNTFMKYDENDEFEK